MAVKEITEVDGLGVLSGGEAFEFESLHEIIGVAQLAGSMESVERLYDRLVLPEVRAALGDDEDDTDPAPRVRSIERDLAPVLTRTDPEKASALTGLRVALSLAADLWLRDWSPDDDSSLRAVVALADPGGELEILEVTEPCLIYHEGSFRYLLGPLGSLPARARVAGAYVVSLVSGRGVAGTTIGRNLVEETRAEAVQRYENSGESELIPDRLLPRTTIESSDQALVLLLHGLLSTDVGSFDAFIRRWREEERSGGVPPARILSWPHDTLDAIGNNARDLARLIEHVFDPRPVPVVFVAHSRGGLVARRTAVELARISASLRSCVRGCVTFGTPHEGADLANFVSVSHLAYYVSITTAAGWDSIYRLSDIFAYAKHL